MHAQLWCRAARREGLASVQRGTRPAHIPNIVCVMGSASSTPGSAGSLHRCQGAGTLSSPLQSPPQAARPHLDAVAAMNGGPPPHPERR
eukprot:CAMPEP_0176269236 /NCGR_PEP_ID=MMETSP0121_2-20121125/44089_1 /TAXON_ID=160619 /ORGANISM="Kryptoperidinium foliaceum, Strain CCMP 1326" /LENGTH=88 /DNA_ID=CAMNT_0017609361 /DNA_START=1 /DNA_END=263 /DNA_ORIENTATION=-